MWTMLGRLMERHIGHLPEFCWLGERKAEQINNDTCHHFHPWKRCPDPCLSSPCSEINQVSFSLYDSNLFKWLFLQWILKWMSLWADQSVHRPFKISGLVSSSLFFFFSHLNAIPQFLLVYKLLFLALALVPQAWEHSVGLRHPHYLCGYSAPEIASHFLTFTMWVWELSHLCPCSSYQFQGG